MLRFFLYTSSKDISLNFLAEDDFSGSELYTPSTLVPLSTMSASISIARKLAVESVVK
jgi:hypothetical protein